MGHRYIFAALASVTVWGSMAVLTTMVLRLPSFFILTIAFGVSSLLGLHEIKRWIVPVPILLLGTYGIFGFHACFVYALAVAPPVEANLIVEIWPMLIVLLSPFFVGGTLKLYHFAGALITFIGATLIVSGSNAIFSQVDPLLYLPAVASAIIWATYSLLTKKHKDFPTAAIGGFCAIAAIISLILHLSLEPRIAPTLSEWVALILIGLGPLGCAFYSWDYALKNGDPRIIGALSYLIPLIATLLLVTVGQEPLTSSTAIAMALIFVGSLIGSLDIFRKRELEVLATDQN